MAGKTVVNQVQLGDSATDSQNFLLKTNIDGTVKLARGAAGTLGDVLTVAADGGVKCNQPAFSAYATADQSVTNGVSTKVALQGEVFDTHNAFDSTANYRFQPLVAGYYQINGILRVGTTSILVAFSELYKNGVSYCRGTEYNGPGLTGYQSTVLETVYLNGSTDYVELWGYLNSTTPIFNANSFSVTSRLSGYLVRAA